MAAGSDLLYNRHVEGAVGRNDGQEIDSETSTSRAGIGAAGGRLERPANDEARRSGDGVDSRAGLPYTSRPLGRGGGQEAAIPFGVASVH